MCPVLGDIWNFCQAHVAFFALLGLAVVNTMPEEPPESFKATFHWSYHWLHDLLKTFVSFKTAKK